MRSNTQNLDADAAKQITNKSTVNTNKKRWDITFRKGQQSKLYKESFGSLGKSIKGAPKAFVKDTGRALKSFDLRESKAIRVMSQLLGAPWNEQKWYIKLIIVFTLICIFPAIPLFYVMGIMMKTLNYLFFTTRRL